MGVAYTDSTSNDFSANDSADLADLDFRRSETIISCDCEVYVRPRVYSGEAFFMPIRQMAADNRHIPGGGQTSWTAAPAIKQQGSKE